MVSVKRSISDISLDKNLSMSSPDLLKTVIIREKSLPNGQMLVSERMLLTLTPFVYTTGFSDDSIKINIRALL